MATGEISEITVLNRKQGYIRGQITRIKTILQDDASLDRTDIAQKLQTVDKLRCKLEDLRGECYCILSDAQLPAFEKSLEGMQIDLDSCEVSFQKLLKSNSNSNVENSQSSGNCKLKLPSINLPEFSGLYVEWLSFKTQFMSLIDENNELSDQQKLFYLQSALKGNAKQLITVNDTYISLFEALKKRFENTRLLIMSHISEIFNCSKIKCESASNLRQMLDKIESNLRSLKQLKLETNPLCEAILIYVIIQRIDIDTRKLYEMELGSELPSWEKFTEFLTKRCQALENVNRGPVVNEFKREPTPKFKTLIVKKL